MATVMWNRKSITNIWKAWQENNFDGIIVFDGNRGLGKTEIKGSKVLMKDGSWKNVEDIKIGDEIISPQIDNSFSYEKVTETHSRFENEIYEVKEATRRKRLLYSCSWNHEIPHLRISHPRKKENGKGTDKRLSKQVLRTADARSLFKIQWASDSSHLCCFTSPAVDYGNKEPNIDGYTLGVFLGDGHFQKDNLGITSENKEIINSIPYPIMSIANKKNTDAKTYRFSMRGEFVKYLKEMGLQFKRSGDKFIPKECLLSPIKYRLNLLAGLIDTDGYVMKNRDNHINITTKSPQLAEDIKNLVFSLGGYSSIRKIKKKCNDFVGTYYSVGVSFQNPKVIPLRNEFKKDRLGNKMNHNPNHIAIRLVKGKPNFVYGFSITGKSRWYITDNWMVTHNSTGAIKCSKLFKRFKMRRDIMFSRDDVMDAVAKYNKGVIVADEMINVAFNREFYGEEQKKLIKMLNMYRDKCNILITCVPNFYSLDSQFRSLVKMRINVIRRGVAVIHTPNQSSFSLDKWDTKYNEKIERGWINKKKFKFGFKKMTTYRGMFKYPDLTPRQKEIYLQVKEEKRSLLMKEKDKEQNEKKLSIYDNIMIQLKDGRLTKEILYKICMINQIKYNTMVKALYDRLKAEDNRYSLQHYLKMGDGKVVVTNNNKFNDSIKSNNEGIVPISI